MLRIAHVITSSGPGGAERQLSMIVRATAGKAAHLVVVLGDKGEMAHEIEKAGAKLIYLQLPTIQGLWIRLKQLISTLKKWDPHLFQGWMYHGDIGAFMLGLAMKKPVIFGIRCAEMPTLPITTRLLRLIEAKISPLTAATVANSNAGMAFHLKLGYKAPKMVVIPNAIDCSLFYKDKKERQVIREKLGIPDYSPVIGYIARADPIKNYPLLLEAARIAVKMKPELHFLLVGKGVSPSNPFFACTKKPPLAGKCHLIDHQVNVRPWLNAMDVYISTSISEGFPNTIAEAMACELPIISTPAGDIPILFKKDCLILPPRPSPQIVGKAIYEMIALSPNRRKSIGRRARSRVCRDFSLESIGQKYFNLWEERLSNTGHKIT